MKGKPGKMLKLVRGDARNSRPGDHMSVIDGMPQGLEAAAAQEQPGAVQIPRQAGAAGGFQEGDRVMLARPFWGALDQETGVLVRDWNGAQTGEPPTYRARSQGTIIYPHPAPEYFVNEMRAKGNYIVRSESWSGTGTERRQESRPPTGREARGPSSTRIPRLNIS